MSKKSEPDAQLETPSLNMPVEDETDEDAEQAEVAGTTPFDEKMLFEAWDHYFAEKKSSLAGFESMVLKKRPVLKENYELELSIKNGVEINILKKMEEDLLSHLRSTLDNHLISITHVQVEEQEGENLYTDTDKFNDMAKRNPALLKLKDRLGLDTDY